MIIGVVKEIHHGERRVAMAPSVVKQCIKTGHSVLVEHGAGVIANFTDEQYQDSGAEIVQSAHKVLSNLPKSENFVVLNFDIDSVDLLKLEKPVHKRYLWEKIKKWEKVEINP